uniref:MD-2-related lipid-recognition domain-containing protein n=1 Tax=Anopheles coluzzii TaxID=1518534 RepID=A0A9I3BD23_ANOCL|nr:uncharacterized protein LOC120957471 [Anopheles coluzzii]
MQNKLFSVSVIALGLLGWNVTVSSQAQTFKYFKMDRIANCEPMDQFPVVMLPNFTVSVNPNENYFNCTLHIKEEIEGPLQYKASIKRCEMDLSKCEYFNTIETNELCDQFEDEGFKDRFLNSISQPLSCPTKPGYYQFTNTKWDLSPVVNLPGTAYRWNIATHVTQLATGRLIYCQEIMARIVVIRKKSNRVKQ